MARALFATAEGFDGAYAEKIGLTQYTVDDVSGLASMMEYLSELALAAAPGAVMPGLRRRIGRARRGKTGWFRIPHISLFG